MGFFASEGSTDSRNSRRLPTDTLRRNGCKLCTLDRADLASPKMEPDGAADPWIYCIGEAPDEDADKRGKPIAGRAGRLLRTYVPRKWEDALRYSNTIDCYPGAGNKPSDVQTECCRGRLVADIEKTRPPVIFAFGNHALQWATGQSRINQWRGRSMPVRIGTHMAWLYPMVHPADILKQKEERGWGDDEQLFAWDMARAFAEIQHLPTPVVHTAADAKRNVIRIHGNEPGALEKVRAFLLEAARQKRCGVDYETRGDRARPYAANAKILSAGVSFGDQCLAFAFNHREAQWSAADQESLADLWIDFLRSPVRKVSHFLSFELEWTGVMFGRDLVRASPWEDTASQAWTLDERVGGHRDGPLSLGWLTQQHFGLNIKKLSNLDRKNLDNEPLEDVLMYQGIDARYHDRLFEAQDSWLTKLKLQKQYALMRDRVATTVLTQIKGIPVDHEVAEKLHSEYQTELSDIDEEIMWLPDVEQFTKKHVEPFNPGSTKQLNELFHSLGIHIDSTDEENLKQVDHPLAASVVRRRKIIKRMGYVYRPRNAPDDDEWVVWPDGLLHPNINTVFVRTGRSSADDPNTQNIIKHDVEGKIIRKQMRARPGHVFVSVDQGQIQARNVVMESRDPVLGKMIWDDYDIHKDWAERISRAYPEAVGGRDNFTDKDVMKAFRQKCKNKWVFPRFFGAQMGTLSSGMEIPDTYLKGPLREWENTFGGLESWHEYLYHSYKENGYITNAEGFVFRAPLSPNKIVNTPIQCDEALVVFGGYTRLSKRDDWFLQAINEVHDDLWFELPVGEVGRCTNIIVDDMLRCDFDWINVPLMVDVSVGENIYDMSEIDGGKFRSDHWHGTPLRAKEFQ